MLKNFNPAHIRTLVPAFYGSFLAFYAAHNWVGFDRFLVNANTHLPHVLQGYVNPGSTAAIIFVYYVAARKLGAKYPGLEKYLLGSAKIPSYTPAP